MAGLLIGIISVRSCRFPEGYTVKIKSDGFLVLIHEDLNHAALAATVYKFTDETNDYIRGFLKIMRLITNRKCFSELLDS